MISKQTLKGLLTRFHYREIERYMVEINESNRPRISETPNTSTKNCTPTKSARSAPAENNDVTVDKGVARESPGVPVPPLCKP